MSNVFRPNRKASDADIIRLNSLGLSLSTIGKMLGCHATTITIRLQQLGVEPSDTRRTFMRDIILSMPQKQRDWLADQLGPQLSIHDYVKNLLAKDYLSSNS